jgi:small-conductance mechanosensitive channel
MKKNPQIAILIAMVALLGLTITGVYLTRTPPTNPSSRKNAKAAQSNAASLVDMQPLDTAQRLAPLAATADEQDFAADALLIADHELELSFAYALRQAAAHSAPSTPETRELAARIKELEPQVKAEQADVERLKKVAAAPASDAKKEAAETQLDIAQTQLDLSQDELEDAHQDMIRAGGDPQSEIQHKLDEHEASHKNKSTAAPPPSKPLYEDTVSSSALSKFLAWREASRKHNLLVAAQAESKARGDDLAARHDRLVAELRAEQDSRGAREKPAPAQSPSAAPAPAAQPSPAAPAAQPSPAAPAASPGKTALALLQRMKSIQSGMAAIDKRVTDFRELETIYGDWSNFVRDRRRVFLNGLLWSAVWIVLIGLLTLLADPLLQRLFARIAPDRSRLHTLRTLVHFSARATGVILILLVLFGAPNNIATIIAFAGAGLTVALKSFIVGFFGWFVLMGRNGIRPGDWVEINGVGGEVLEVGLLHTVLLETGNWSDAGHPTGRKVTFVNSFAIDGHYFNFSTSGQWLWDELQILVPAEADPYATAEAIQKIAAEETQANARLAEQEWERVVPSDLRGAVRAVVPGAVGADPSVRPSAAPGATSRAFSAEPVMSIRPGNLGVNVLVRYITRVQERHEVRSRLYHKTVELLHGKQVAPNVS